MAKGLPKKVYVYKDDDGYVEAYISLDDLVIEDEERIVGVYELTGKAMVKIEVKSKLIVKKID